MNKLKILHIAWDILVLSTYLLIILNSNLPDVLSDNPMFKGLESGL